ncbi:hypothetical protein P3T76_000783 [Phytophthora citrophthora]|uniref:PTM/DIR17-like Tudor domain-containing protein n=1 Tax=Phytophthora citrophthora TaxID=4793 RepID=A0AAD9H0K7_9STRA|nr:hypothetical protein P3T76_000783 [Phytophthora citrophthora]
MPSPSGSASSADATSSTFSSAPINRVTTSHRRKNDVAWLSDSQNQNAANDGSPSSSGTQDEDVRVKPARPSSVSSQGSSGSDKEKIERQKLQRLPSLSPGGVALLQLRSNSPPDSNNKTSTAPSSTETSVQANASIGASQINSFRRATPREEGNPLIPDEEMNEEEDEAGEEDPSAPPSPSDHKEIRIMFHDREIFAEDLIGLRVAKTFAGHGRFLGQVVKFDKRVALYTVVYADGDAEDLTVDGTLQILIQDEIERANPAQLSPAISLLFKKIEEGASPASPGAGTFMTQPPTAQHQPTAAPRRVKIQVSEREAQFVISLFENHALPSLVRQGWRVKTSNSGRGETRFVSPAGEIFPSALDVVGYIALDKELLTGCFPANVHSAILSLLPRDVATNSSAETGNNQGSAGNASRKRTASDSPSAEQFDGKRTRQVRDEAYGAVGIPMRGRAADTAVYRHDDLDRRAEAANRLAAYRGQGMGGRIRMSGDQFIGGETTSEARIQAPPDLRGYRRVTSRDPSSDNPFSSRWASGEAPPGRAEAAEYARRFGNSPGRRERGDMFISDRHLEARNRTRAEGRYIHRLSVRNHHDGLEGGRVAALSTPTSYYRDSSGSPAGGQASPMPSGLAYPQYSTIRARNSEYSRVSAAPRASRETASFMSPTDTLGASAAFSMMDVDRISKPRPDSSNSEHLRGRSPRQNESYLQHQALQQHRRTSSGHSYHGPRSSDGHYSTEPTSEAQKEVTSGTSTTPNQQP